MLAHTRRSLIAATAGLFLAAPPHPSWCAPVPSFAGDDFGPRDLGRKAQAARKQAARVRADIVEQITKWSEKHAQSRPDSVAALRALVARWVPGSAELESAEGVGRDRLEQQERELATTFADELVEVADRMLSCGLGGAAGFEAYRALGLDPAHDGAAELLGYEKVEGIHRHPREATGAGPVEANHGTPQGPLVHVRAFTFFEVHTDVSQDIADEWGGELDRILLWMRARFLHVPRYREPPWPIEVRIYSSEEVLRENQERVPAGGFAHWEPRAKHVVVLADAFQEGRTMPMEWVVKHELAHAFLDLGFPTIPDPKTGIDNAVSGWLTEGFEAWIYAAASERPNDVRFWESIRVERQAELELLAGEDVLSELVDKGWIESRSNPLADVAPILADYCAADEIRWEGFARLTANLHSYNQASGDFRAQLGSPSKVSKALKAWIEEHR